MRGKHPTLLLLGLAAGAAILETNMENTQATGNSPTMWPSNPTAGNITEISDTYNEKASCIPVFIAAQSITPKM